MTLRSAGDGAFRWNLELGEQVVGLRGDAASWADALTPRYDRFRTSRPAEIEIDLTATGVPLAAELLRLQVVAPTIRLDGGELRIDGPGYRAEIDLACRRGRLEGPLHRAGFDALARALIALALREDGLLLHGALLIDGERAYSCVAPSGQGKTTLTRLLPEQARCDELHAVRRDGSGEWRALALPFWHGAPGRGRLSAVYRLSHGRRHQVHELAPAEALRRLATEVIWPAHDPEGVETSLELLAKLVREVPCRELRFVPEPGVWSAIRRGVAA